MYADTPPVPLRITHQLSGVPDLHVALAGEVDLSNAHVLARGLRELLRSYPDLPVVLDLSELGFCDCVGLSVLLEARSSAMARLQCLRVAAVSRPVSRLLEVTGTAELFGAPVVRRAGSRSYAGAGVVDLMCGVGGV